MNMKALNNLKMVILRPLLQFVIFSIFLIYFGLPAIQKFEKKEVMVVKRKVNSNGIELPAITIGGMNPETSDGWKDNINTGNWGGLLETHCSTEETAEECIENKTYNITESIKDVLLGYTTKKSLLNQTKFWTEDFMVGWMGRSYTLNISQKVGSDYKRDQLFLTFDSNLKYDIYIHDPNYFVININPVGPPVLNLELNPKTTKSFYYGLVLTKVEELDLPDDPCNMDRSYNYHACVKESLSGKVGCRTKWDQWSHREWPLCTQLDQFR